MITLALFFVLIACICYTILSIRWLEVYDVDMEPTHENFSVVIALRNEESTVVSLLSDFEKQTIKDFEIILVDDFSTDQTFNIVTAYQRTSALDLKVIRLENEEEQGKKSALTNGIYVAKHPIILTIDADCRIGTGWVASYKSAFGRANALAGPVRLTGDSFFQRLQKVEFAGLMGLSAYYLAKKSPGICSGANLGFRKECFVEVDGYEDNLYIASGDDEFLMHKINKKYPETAFYLPNSDSIVETRALAGFKAFIQQRKRWTWKWRFNRNGNFKRLMTLLGLDQIIFGILLCCSFLKLIAPVAVLILLLVRYLSYVPFVALISKSFGIRQSCLLLMALSIIYPFYVLFIALNSIFGSYSWKGRKY